MNSWAWGSAWWVRAAPGGGSASEPSPSVVYEGLLVVVVLVDEAVTSKSPEAALLPGRNRGNLKDMSMLRGRYAVAFRGLFFRDRKSVPCIVYGVAPAVGNAPPTRGGIQAGIAGVARVGMGVG